MDSVLIVNQDLDWLKQIKTYLEQLAQFEVITASNGQFIQKTLETMPVSVLVLDIEPPEVDALAVLTDITRQHTNLACIVTSARAVPVFPDIKPSEAILRYLEKTSDFGPFAIDIFEALTLKDLGGSFGDMPLRYFLPLFKMVGKSGCLQIDSYEKNPGFLYFDKGNLIDAEYDALDAEEAARQLIDQCAATHMTLTALPENKRKDRIQKEIIHLVGGHWSDESPREKKATTHFQDAVLKKADEIEPLETAADTLSDTQPETTEMATLDRKADPLNVACQALLNEIDDARGVALIDISNGKILAFAQTARCMAQSHAATVATTMDLFKSDAVKKLISLEQGGEEYKKITQVQMTTKRTYHFMSIVPDKENVLLVLATGKQSNLGFGWMAMREALAIVGPLCS